MALSDSTESVGPFPAALCLTLALSSVNPGVTPESYSELDPVGSRPWDPATVGLRVGAGVFLLRQILVEGCASSRRNQRRKKQQNDDARRGRRIARS